MARYIGKRRRQTEHLYQAGLEDARAGRLPAKTAGRYWQGYQWEQLTAEESRTVYADWERVKPDDATAQQRHADEAQARERGA